MLDQRKLDRAILNEVPNGALTKEMLSLEFWAYATQDTLLERAKAVIDGERDAGEWYNLLRNRWPLIPPFYADECVNLYLVYTWEEEAEDEESQDSPDHRRILDPTDDNYWTEYYSVPWKSSRPVSEDMSDEDRFFA